MPAERELRAEFTYRPRPGAAIDALYIAHPELRGKIMALLGVSITGMVLGLGTAVTGGQPVVWAACLALGSLALAMLGWWALAQSHGSVFAAGPGTVYVDDNGLLVRPAHNGPLERPAHAGLLVRPAHNGQLMRPAHDGQLMRSAYGGPGRSAPAEPALLPWSSLRGWSETDKVIVLFPNVRCGRPLHVIPSRAVESSDTAPIFRELLRWHLGKPKPWLRQVEVYRHA
jgi:hypothetical protein